MGGSPTSGTRRRRSRPDELQATARPRRAIRPCLDGADRWRDRPDVQGRQARSSIGRAPTCEIRLDDDGISRSHARGFARDTGRAWIEDLGSRNGTFVNGVKIDDADRARATATRSRSAAPRSCGSGSTTRSTRRSTRTLSSALRDGLTKLFNKRYLMDRLDSELKFAQRHETALSLLMLDLDHFKKINDTHGHLAGDMRASRDVAARCSRAVRNEDVVARFGGEEIAIVLRAIGARAGDATWPSACASSIEALEHRDRRQERQATVSIGVAGFRSPRPRPSRS